MNSFVSLNCWLFTFRYVSICNVHIIFDSCFEGFDLMENYDFSVWFGYYRTENIILQANSPNNQLFKFT